MRTITTPLQTTIGKPTMINSILAKSSLVALLAASVGTPALAVPTMNSLDVSNKSIDSEGSSVGKLMNTTGKLPVQFAQARNCRYSDNLNLTAIEFIGKCVRGSVLEVFPSEYYYATLGEINVLRRRSRSARTAFKLLNDSRFRK